MKPTINLSALRYFQIQKHWRKLGPLFRSKPCEMLWKPNLRDWSEQKAVEHKFKYKYDPTRYSLPTDHDSCDWRFSPERTRRGPDPAFWDYTCWSACHYLIDANLYVISTAYPKIPWTVITQRHHSTIWNRSCDDPVLFDPNFLALDVGVREAWKIASRGRLLSPGEMLRPYCLVKGYFDDDSTDRISFSA